MIDDIEETFSLVSNRPGASLDVAKGTLLQVFEEHVVNSKSELCIISINYKKILHFFAEEKIFSNEISVST